MSQVLEKPKKKRKPSTEAARQLFLYGDGSGRRFTVVKELAEESGVHENTIRRNLPDWEAQYESMVASGSKLGMTNTLSISNEVLEDHSKDLCFFRRNLTTLQAEHDAFDSIIAKLEVIVENLSLQSEDSEAAIALFDKYLRVSMNKRNLMNQIIALKKIYDEKCGLDTIKSVQEATMKAQSLSSLRTENPSPNEQTQTQVVANGVFRKRE